MRIEMIELELAARRNRARAIVALIATAFAWIVNLKQRFGHAARPHFAR